jgi:DNA-binding NtrC family response regulator
MVAFEVGWIDDAAFSIVSRTITVWLLVLAAYLVGGAIARFRRMRRLGDAIDPIARRWIGAGGLTTALPLAGCWLLQLVRPEACLGGGYRPLIALAMAGGSACILIAMARQRFGELDRTLGRAAGVLLAGGVAAALVLTLFALLGARGPAGGAGLAVLGGSLVVGLFLGPLGAQLQRTVDERLSAEHGRAVARMRTTVEEAAATLDLSELEGIVTRGVREALGARACALYVAADGDDSPLRRSAIAGSAPEVPDLLAEDAAPPPGCFAIRRRATLPATRRGARRLEHEPAPRTILLVAPSPERCLDENDRHLLAASAASLSVAFANAAAHTALKRLSERLEAEVAQSELRRRQVARLKERIEEEKHVVEGELARIGGRPPVIGEGLRPTFELVHRAACTDLTVLVSGETGVGKELVARALHAGSARRSGPFVVVDCQGDPERLEATLFGQVRDRHVAGARAERGAFRSASGGTLFLDEVGALPSPLQAKVLRALEERRILPVGADAEVEVDVRVIAATRRDLDEAVRAGAFRADLLYGLRVLQVAVPALRERLDDLPELAASFLQALAEDGKRVVRALSQEALRTLRQHDWPGNVRELKHVVEAAAVACDADEIRPGDLRIDAEIFRRKADAAILRAGDEGPGLRETLSTLERERLVQVLREHDGNQSVAARALGLSRGAFRRRLARYKIA